MMYNKKITELLVDSLEVLARITGGYATVTNLDGVRLKTVDSNGVEIEELKGVTYTLAKKAADLGKTISGKSQLESGAESWCLPLGDYVICCSNIERVKRDNELLNALKDSLPYIARVAGGEAVIFDQDGKRISAVDSKGNPKVEFIGTNSDAAEKSMISQRPVFGKSMSINGAIAVRIPITKYYGFGFNNEDAVKKSQKLANEVKKYQYAKYNFSDIIGESTKMKKVKEIARLAANSHSNVLIYGETGTGKELFAQSIHNASYRFNKPFVAINCAAIPPSLVESHLFGYEKGAFTGARRDGYAGVFEQANGGTLFLDEISEMELDMQAKLLRVLQEREVKRIGGKKIIPLNIRVISATNKPLDELVKSGKFRQDLFYRLNVFDIKLVPLRYMKEDIPLIVNHAIQDLNMTFGKFIKGIDDQALELLLQYSWPGNVRELLNCLEKAFNLVPDEGYIKKEHLEFKFKQRDSLNTNLGLSDQVEMYEKNLIESALGKAEGIKIEAAKMLKISTTTLWRKMKKYKINF